MKSEDEEVNFHLPILPPSIYSIYMFTWRKREIYESTLSEVIIESIPRVNRN